MAFENLSARLEDAFRSLRAKGSLTEKDVRTAMRQLRVALLEADVNLAVARDFTNTVTERAIGQKILESLTPAQMVVKIVNEELIQLMGGTTAKLAQAPHGPTVIMLCGLQGSGKTTHAGKLALWLKNQKHHPLLVACDIYRPAAIEQLRIVADKVGTAFYENGTQNPVQTAREALQLARDKGNDYVLLDTAGRLHIDETLMDELRAFKQEIQPHEILLVVDAMTGQDAVVAATAFDAALGVDGLLLTKLDSDTRGGAALSARAVTGKPIKFVGQGEKPEDLDVFYPERMASRILGQGDVLSLIEKAESVYSHKQAEQLQEKMEQNRFDLNDLLEQFRQIRKLGSLKDILGMVPGVGTKLRDVEIDEKTFDRVQALILSMTPKERAHPEIINPSRKRRIAAGAAQRVEDVNKLLGQYREMQKMFKGMNPRQQKHMQARRRGASR
jgi:signal recognition particle subunit SRP54